MGIINSIFALLAALGRWLANRSEPVAVRRRDAVQLEREVQAAHDEAAGGKGKEDAINRRIGRLTRAVPLVAALCLCGGCVTHTVYVPEADRVVAMDRDGRAGWWVPAGVMATLLEKTERYEAAKKEEK